MKKFLDLILNFLIPPVCPICLERVEVVHTLCPKCFSKLKFITHPCCEICGYPFEFDLDGEHVCGRCLKDPPAYHHARALFVYNDASKSLILPFKHGDRMELAQLFVKLLAQNYADIIKENDVIIPVPLHIRRLVKRKYNQSALIAQPLARKFKKIYLPTTLKRVRATPSQGHLTALERKKNVANAFMVKYPAKIKGKNVLLVDDVMTTGATVNECAKVLLKAGAKQVDVLTICRLANI